MAGQAELLKDLRIQVKALEEDLRERSTSVPEFRDSLRQEYDRALSAQRIAVTFGQWSDERITQIAVAWVLGTVFVRYCEDNQLIEWPWISGPGSRLLDAEDRHSAFFQENPSLNDRDWLIASFDHLASCHSAVAGLFDKAHNPLWEADPSYEAATGLLNFWRRKDSEGAVAYDLTGWDTRFLGDLYQDLSESARKTYALLQTPVFVEEFILDLTLTPAIEEFGLTPEWRHTPAKWRGEDPTQEKATGLRTIDPACGSGHFLLGIFSRLVARWEEEDSTLNRWEIVRRALNSVHGCDKNPFAVAIARFRLLVAALAVAGETRLDRAPAFPINIAVGDSLLHGRGSESVSEDLFSLNEPFLFATEDVDGFITSCDLLGIGTYHVVVGNPPYITVKDKQENENYRKAYKKTCSGKYALSVPFAQRLFDLAIRVEDSSRRGGFTGQITSNSFMKREFGDKLIAWFHERINLTHVIDTSGAFIPGHGTPTVILIGRNHFPAPTSTIRGLLGKRGEPGKPEDPAEALVWAAIATQVDNPGSESEWISSANLERATLREHPWSLSGGGAGDLQETIEAAATERLELRADSLGITCFTLEDDLYLLPRKSACRSRLDDEWLRPMVTGDLLRDWSGGDFEVSVFPYSESFEPIDVEEQTDLFRYLWPCRTTISNNVLFGRKTKVQGGLKWTEFGRLTSSKLKTPLSITFAEVATHNHFVLDRGGKVFKQTAPVIKLSEKASADEHLALLGLLNSSTACFWLKQVCHVKGGSGIGRGVQDEQWEARYAFNATRLEEFPLPSALPLDLGRVLDSEATRYRLDDPSLAFGADELGRAGLERARVRQTAARERMISAQEELDWRVYGSYDLLSQDELDRTTSATELDALPGVRLGERAFEIVLARKVQAGELDTAWFARHGSTPITEIPERWPEAYKKVVQARIGLIEKRRDLALIERPECKRRWAGDSWEKKEKAALRTWLLDRCEREDLWFGLRNEFRQPRTMTVSELADRFRTDDDMNSVAQLYATDHLGKRDLPLAKILEEVLADEHVPYAAALRYKDSGLRKRTDWEHTWEQQREEDRTGKRLDIQVPPKYGSADFRKPGYWSNRGKFDVPKERFISYPGASLHSDDPLLLGWAGWDHKDQAQALVNLVNDRHLEAGWEQDRLKPLLAGLLELLPWTRQWHGTYDEEWEGVPADEFEGFLTEQRSRLQLSEKDLKDWHPSKEFLKGTKA